MDNLNTKDNEQEKVLNPIKKDNQIEELEED